MAPVDDRKASVAAVVSPSAAPGRRTGLVVLVPEMEPVVAEWRSALDPSAWKGMPAHVTVLFPWFRARELTPELLGELSGVAAGSPAFDAGFERVDRFEETLWLAPSPLEPFAELTEAVRRRWPEHPPFEFRYETVVPHLTIADGIDPGAHAHVVADVERRLPVRCRVGALTLMAQDRADHWGVHSSYPLLR